jgi:heme/copper-type cytochrome/quinol oxidase subunit 2
MIEFVLLTLKFGGLAIFLVFIWASFYYGCVTANFVDAKDGKAVNLVVFIFAPLIFVLFILFLIPSRIISLFK